MLEAGLVDLLHQLRPVDVVLFMGVVWLILSGSLGRLISKTKKAKIGPVEYEAEDNSVDVSRIDRRHDDCRADVAAKFAAIRKDMDMDRENMTSAMTSLTQKLDSGNAVIASFKETLADVALGQKKLTFYTDSIPDAQQLAAGLEYVAAGGNGECRKDVTKFVLGKKDMYDAICAVNPALRLSSLESPRREDAK